MIIKKILINGFGNIENETIEFNNNINLIYGENEAGKSTLAYFIKCIFYGINKNKAGNEFSEYERFKPWKDIDFSGKIEYEVNGEKFIAFRDFNRNNCKVYDSNGNDITNKFNKDKNRGVEIGIAHLGVDEETFMNTLLVNQSNISVDIPLQKNIIQKLTNIIQTGQENISFEKIKTKLQKKILDEIGTDRSQNKPINIINKEIAEKEQNRIRLLNNRDKKDVLDVSSKEIEEQIKKTEQDIDEAKQVLAVKEKYLSVLEEKEKTYELTQKIKEKERQDKITKIKSQYKIFVGILIIISLIIATALIFYKQYIWIGVEALLIILANIVLKLTIRKEHLEESVQDFTIIKEEINKKELKELDKLNKNGIRETLTNRKANELKSLLNGLEKKKNDLILDEHKIKIEEGSLKENIDKLSEIEEQLVELNDKKSKLEVKRTVINIAIDKLEEAYNEIKSEVIPKMELNIRDMIAKTTNNKYTNIIYNNDTGILIENDIGEIVSVKKLSIGTIDQIYLGFRMGISEELKKIPIILDESFAFYDNVRLNNILLNLSKIDKQIIILTCSNREKEILEDLKIKYNYMII